MEEHITMWYEIAMAADLEPNAVLQTETAAQRDAHVLREAELIARAHAELNAGLGIHDDDFEAWLDALERDDSTELPAPKVDRA